MDEVVTVRPEYKQYVRDGCLDMASGVMAGENNLYLLIGDESFCLCSLTSLSSHGCSCALGLTSSPEQASKGGSKWETHLSNRWTSH